MWGSSIGKDGEIEQTAAGNRESGRVNQWQQKWECENRADGSRKWESGRVNQWQQC